MDDDRCARCGAPAAYCPLYEDVGFGAQCCEDCSHQAAPEDDPGPAEIRGNLNFYPSGPTWAPVLPPEDQLVDGINEIELSPNLSTRFGYCRRCGFVYPPDEPHTCPGDSPPDLEAAADGWEALEDVALEQGWDDGPEDEA